MSDNGRTDDEWDEAGEPEFSDAFEDMEEWPFPDEAWGTDEEPPADERRGWVKFWRAITIILTCATALFFMLTKRARSRYSTGDVALVIVDDFSGEKSHGADVERAARSALFVECQIKRIQFRGEDAGSLKKALEEVLAYRREHKDMPLVINFSFGSYSNRSMEERAIQALSGSRTLMVAAAGNDDTDRPMFPAAYDPVLAVAAVTSAGVKTSYSNHGKHIDLWAVPEQIVERQFKGIEFHAGRGVARYVYLIRGGTSLSAPRVAAVAASIWCVRSGLTADEVKAILLKTSDPVGAGHFGYGILSVRSAQAEVLPFAVLCERCATVSFVAALVALFIWGLTYGLRRPRW